MQPLDTELNEISFSDWGTITHLFSKHFKLHVLNRFWRFFSILPNFKGQKRAYSQKLKAELACDIVLLHVVKNHWITWTDDDSLRIFENHNFIFWGVLDDRNSEINLEFVSSIWIHLQTLLFFSEYEKTHLRSKILIFKVLGIYSKTCI